MKSATEIGVMPWGEGAFAVKEKKQELLCDVYMRQLQRQYPTVKFVKRTYEYYGRRIHSVFIEFNGMIDEIAALKISNHNEGRWDRIAYREAREINKYP